MAIFEFTGTVHNLAERQSFQGRFGDKTFQKQEVVFQLDGKAEYPDYIALVAFGEDVNDVAALRLGDHCRVKFYPKAREYNGRWYNDLRILAVSDVQSAQDQEDRKAAVKEKVEKILNGEVDGSGQDDDLPF